MRLSNVSLVVLLCASNSVSYRPFHSSQELANSSSFSVLQGARIFPLYFWIILVAQVHFHHKGLLHGGHLQGLGTGANTGCHAESLSTNYHSSIMQVQLASIFIPHIIYAPPFPMVNLSINSLSMLVLCRTDQYEVQSGTGSPCRLFFAGNGHNCPSTRHLQLLNDFSKHLR